MHILFVHQNFPGQFKFLAPALAEKGHEVIAMTLQQGELEKSCGVEIVRYTVPRGTSQEIHPWVADFETKIIRAEAAFRAAIVLKETGFAPDVIIAHPGWGESLFLKDVWPEAKLGVYCEFFYHAKGADVDFDSEFSLSDPGEVCRIRLKNLNNKLHFEVADAGISPTKWQASTFPEPFRSRITVVHDGIDATVLVPNPDISITLSGKVILTKKDEVLTFVNRNLEPSRGYHIFMRALPAILQQRPNAHILIIGGDGVGYGAAPKGEKSWKEIFANEVRAQISDADWNRIYFLGNLPYQQYLAVLQLSTVHVYLTYPFVLSWSLLEAMSVGCAIVASDTPPLKEVISHNETGRLVNFFDEKALATEVCALLNAPGMRAYLGDAARKFIQQNFDLKTICLPRQLDWVNELAECSTLSASGSSQSSSTFQGELVDKLEKRLERSVNYFGRLSAESLFDQSAVSRGAQRESKRRKSKRSIRRGVPLNTEKTPSHQAMSRLVDLFAQRRFEELELQVRVFIVQHPEHGFGWKVLGTTLKQMNRLAEALESMQKAAKLLPTDAEVHNNLGNILKLIGSLNEAEACYQRALQLKPHYAEALVNLGGILEKQNRFEEAEATYRQALQIRPDFAEAHNNLGVILQHRGNLQEAEASYRLAVQFKPDYAEAYSNFGNVMKELGQMGESLAAYQRALEIKPDFVEAHCNLGIAYKELGRIKEAEVSFYCALRINPNCAEANLNLGNIFKEMSRLDDALASYHRALQINPVYAKAHFSLGVTLQEMGCLTEAEASYRQAQEIDPDYAEACNNQGVTLYELDCLAEAEVCYRRALAINPDFVDAYTNLGIVLKSLGRLEEAEASCRRALQISPSYFAAHNNLGIILYEAGRLQEAVASCRRALEINPNFADAHNNLASALTNAGNDDEAIAHYRKALECNPNSAPTYFNLHALLMAPNNMENAIECMAKAVEIDSSNPNYKFILGMILDYAGKPENAVSHFEFVEMSEPLYRARLDAWRYIKAKNNKLPITGSISQAFRKGFDIAPHEGLVLEFGVRFGSSIRLIAALAGQEVHGFDSFEGLPEAWHNEPKGSYTTGGVIPDVPDNVRLHIGWFENTIPTFLNSNSGPVRFMNIDCDIYSSTRTILELLEGRIIPGTVIVFDEYIGNEHWREDEFKAFQEAVTKYNWTYEYICFSFFTKQVVVRIT